MDATKIVVDANILFSALLRDNTAYSRIILDTARTFYLCESTIIELFKHKERIVPKYAIRHFSFAGILT